MKVELRVMDATTLPLVLPLIADYHAFESLDSSAAEREAAARQLLDNPDIGGIWLVYCDEKLAGYIALCRGFSIEFNGFDAFVDEFFLAESFRGRGVGGQVLSAIRAEARTRQINALHLEVARDNQAARRLYQAAGFEAREKYVLMTALLGEDE
ncbi:MAG: GNAT family N-acetyltransferase [Gammaproteobacteria bacterium]|nr:GNAT family N-acetyltransferase [Gammaproteobacteria bacterium]